MCGIIGVVSPSPASRRVVEGLHRLEYRGYDSAGIAALSCGELLLAKGVGCIDDVCPGGEAVTLENSVAIGHTRWATHGGVTRANAHPHTDSSDTIAVVHNGIIENYAQLRADLVRAGVEFRSETDSEVIPHLLRRTLNSGVASLEDAVRFVAGLLEGSFSFLAISAAEPGTMVGIRKDNPLVVGLGEECFFLSSDSLAFCSSASHMILPSNGEVVVVTQQGVRITDAHGQEVGHEKLKVDATWSETSKDGHPHYMLKEILEQPRALLQTLYQDEMYFMQMAIELLRARSVVFTACGTSRHASLIGRLLFSKVAGKMSDVVMGSEYEYFVDSADKHTVIIAVSQSGETADVLDGVRAAKGSGAKILAVVNRPSCLLADESDYVINLNCGAEIGVAANKSFLSQVSIFYMLAHAMANELPEAMWALQDASAHLDNLLTSVNGSLERLMHRFVGKNHMYFIGRGMNFPLAMEGALKMKEISYVHAEGMPAGELKHGSIALIEEGTPVVAICPEDEAYDATVSNCMEAKSRGAYVIGISDVRNPVFDTWVPIPQVSKLQYPMLAVVPLQLMAYYMAVLRGCDPDRPRNLAKSVTVR